MSQQKSSFGADLKKSTLLPKCFREELRQFAEDSATKSEVVNALKNNEIIFEYSETRINLYSAPKSIMGLLFGISVENCLVTLNESLGSLGIDENKTL